MSSSIKKEEEIVQTHFEVNFVQITTKCSVGLKFNPLGIYIKWAEHIFL
jgi:hypothetical protein